jgi:hypothetical protein
MEQFGLFLLGWLIVAAPVALAMGKFFREANRLDEPATPATADRQRPERRMSIKRTQDRGGSSSNGSRTGLHV